MGKIHDRFKFASARGVTREQFATRARKPLAFYGNELEPDAPARHDPALKGKKDGNCNRSACQKPGAYYYNRGSCAHYCIRCAVDIGSWSPDELDLFPDLKPDEREPEHVHRVWAKRQEWIERRKVGDGLVRAQRRSAELFFPLEP